MTIRNGSGKCSLFVFYQPMDVCSRLINQSNRSISVCFLLLFCSRVFISRSYENRSTSEYPMMLSCLRDKGSRHE